MTPDAHDPVYRLPPDELEPEVTYSARLFAAMADERDWGHVPLGLEVLHGRGVRGAGVLVAVLDTGIDKAHPDLRERVAGGHDFTGGADWTDNQNHGTHCSGIVAAATNGDGLIGAAPEAKLLVGKVLDDSGSGRSSWIAAGIRWAAEGGADVISLSLGGPGTDAATREAIRFAVSKGCWVVAAAGNTGKADDNFPGHYAESCAVAACDKQLRRATFSTINVENDIAAPGVSILSTLPGGRYGQMSGTSMATPYVAGCLALVRGELKRLGRPVPPQSGMIAALKRTARDLGLNGTDGETGAGLVEPAKLLAELIGVTGPVTPPPGAYPARKVTGGVRVDGVQVSFEGDFAVGARTVVGRCTLSRTE